MRRLLVGCLAVVAAACTSNSAGAPAVSPSASTTSSTPAPASSTSTTAASSTTSSTTTTAAPTTTVPPTTTTTIPDLIQERAIGTSVQGRPITAIERGTPGGKVILVVGVIHGDEAAGLAVIDLLRTAPLPAGIDLWLLPAINPDGLANQTRKNANGVDLNRNFPHDWTQIGTPDDWEYSGTGPASEPETKAFIAFASEIKPHLTLWYHQNAFRISPTTGPEGALRKRYAQLTGLPYKAVTGGIYTGVAATWIHRTVPGAISFIVELGDTLSPADAVVHANAVLDVAVRS